MESDSILGTHDVSSSVHVIEGTLELLGSAVEDKGTQDLGQIYEMYKTVRDMTNEGNLKLVLLMKNLNFEDDNLASEEAKDSPAGLYEQLQQIPYEHEQKQNLVKSLNRLKSKRQQAIDEIRKLGGKVKSLEATLRNLIAEEHKACELEEQKKIALEKALAKYESVFDFTVDICNECETTYEAHIKFENDKIVKPLIIRVDKKSRQITDMDVSDLLPEEVKQEMLLKYSDPRDTPKLFCAIREFLIEYS